MSIILYFLCIKYLLGFSIPFIKTQTEVILHLEKFNEKLNLLHIGISFKNNNDIIRFDFRPYNYGKTYLTSESERNNLNLLFADTELDDVHLNFFNNNNRNILIIDNNIQKKKIFWGFSNKTLNEILDFENDYLINKKYKVGIYDCRHYVNEFTMWCLDKPTPIWKLNLLWDDIN